ncbi:MAG: 3-oxoacyl-[acyl-carrier protein] reductase [Ramlibacter sp.]|nr:3-oxoacyl-[acyl-carrier protein] reductase [Ramlibacter sp.]
MGKLDGKVAIITGGGTGIGAATAKLFVEQGASVLLVGRREDKLIETAKEIGGDRVSYAVADTSQVEDSRRYIAAAVTRYSGIDILVSNAGIEGPIKLTGDHSVEDFDEVIAVNVRGVWLSYKYALPELTRRGGGSVVLMSSVGGLVGFPTMSPYVASKHAVIGLAKSFAQECAGFNIRVNAVCPGFIDTDMFDALTTKFAPVAGASEEALTGVFEARVPLKRKGTSEEIAQLNLFLASADSSYVTGSAYVIDGGITAGVL